MKNVEDIYPLSPAQAGMLFHTIAAPESDVYFQQYTCTINGEFDHELFAHAWQQIIDRHPALRTAFIWDGIEQPLQVVRQEAEIAFVLHDWQTVPHDEQATRFAEFLMQDRRTGLDLAHAPVARIAVIRIAAKTHHLIWSFHHLISDGWSTPMILQEVFACYEAFVRKQTPSLATRRPYRDYIAWIKQQDSSAAERFWRDELKDFTAPTVLPVKQLFTKHANDQIVPEQSNYQKQAYRFSIENTTTLQAFAQEHRVTLNTLLQGAWAILLSRYSSETDVVFGVTVSGRPATLQGVEEMIGMLINTLPARVDVSSNASLASWLQALQSRQLDIRDYEYSALADVQKWSDLPPGTSLFETLVVFENYPLEGSSYLPVESELTIEDVEYHEHSNFPLTVLAVPEEHLALYMIYDRAQYEDETVTRMLGHLQTLLNTMVKNPTQRIADLVMLTPEEYQQLLIDWNATSVDCPLDQCIHHLIEEQALKTPDATAVIYENEQLSYREFKTRTDELAARLKKLGIGPNMLVGLCLERSIEMIVAIIGILKAGGAYLPLDPGYPVSRLTFMLEDTEAPLLITTQTLLNSLPELAMQTEVDDTSINDQYLVRKTRFVGKGNINIEDQEPEPADLAYVIYTSGSTGTPKGVSITHRNLVHSTTARCHFYPDNLTSFLLLSSFAFDSSVVGIFWTLCTGGTLVLPRQREEHDVQRLAELIERHQVSHTLCLPSVYNLLLMYAKQESLKSLVAVIVAGETCSSELVLQHYDRLPNTALYNEYGPTEGTVWATACQLVPDEPPTIGRAIPNMKTYILDENRQPVPIGIPGELYIHGEGIAQGYLNRPELSQDKFVNLNELTSSTHLNGPTSRSRQSEIVDRRCYRTGDLARYLPNGSIEFLGRIDDQVKLRGHRIELGEIEAILAQHPDVELSAVVVQSTQSLLVAYITPRQGKDVTTGEIKSHLEDKLPHYMVPSQIAFVDSLPRTSNGKIDRRALTGAKYFVEDAEPVAKTPPATETERSIAALWEKLLGIGEVNVHDDFFTVGGHSLLVIQLIAQLRTQFELPLPVNWVFDYRTLAQMADQIDILRWVKVSTSSEKSSDSVNGTRETEEREEFEI
ncbi:amino acid adenylation domain-containing protein [Chloroflexi bacterium TSY]|nr:amino acid adenylation domain-containing protein [Chloroflexi bacterium TSY]